MNSFLLLDEGVVTVAMLRIPLWSVEATKKQG